MALHLGCTVVAFEALAANAARAVQTVVEASQHRSTALDSDAADDDSSWLSRFVVYHNAVGSQRGRQVDVKLSTTNSALSAIIRRAPQPSEVIEQVTTVLVDDLLFDAPLEQRPMVVVNGVATPLQPQHIVLVKVNVVDQDVPAIFGMRRLLQSRHRPRSIMLSFAPRPAWEQKCDALAFVRFMYTAGYAYERQPTLHEMLLDTKRAYEGRNSGLGVRAGWWDL
jgi:hypothetical protein